MYLEIKIILRIGLTNSIKLALTKSNSKIDKTLKVDKPIKIISKMGCTNSILFRVIFFITNQLI